MLSWRTKRGRIGESASPEGPPGKDSKNRRSLGGRWVGFGSQNSGPSASYGPGRNGREWREHKSRRNRLHPRSDRVSLTTWWAEQGLIVHSEFRLWQSIGGGMSNWAFSKRQRACCRRGGQARSAPYTADYQPDMLRYCAEARTLRGDRIRNRVNVTGVQAGCGGTCPSWPRVTRSDCRWRALCRRSGIGRGRATCRPFCARATVPHREIKLAQRLPDCQEGVVRHPGWLQRQEIGEVEQRGLELLPDSPEL